MVKLRKQKILCFILVYMLFNFQNANALKIFSRDKYIVPEGKSILLSPEFQNSDKKFKWTSENPSVVSIDTKGVAYAKSRGKSVIKATDKNGKNMSECVVEVAEKDPFRIVYSSSNPVSTNEYFKIKAITYKNVELLRFEVKGENYSKTFECRTKSNYFDYYLWEDAIKLPCNGSYHIEAFAKVGKSWRTCKEGNSDIMVSEKYNRKEPSLTKKMVSRECSDMIAAWEGSRSSVYKDSAGFLTIGYGKRIYPYEVFYNNLSPEEMKNALLYSLNHSEYSKNVNEFLIKNKIKFNQNQFDALVSLTYNLGCGWIYSNGGLAKIILDSTKNEKNSLIGIVNSSDGLWVREEPSTSKKKLSILRNGEKVDVLNPQKINERWYKVRTQDGINGYCCSDYMDLVKTYKGTKNLDDIDRKQFIREFLKFHHAGGGKCNKGLLERRYGELNMFFKGEYRRLRSLKSSNVPYEIPACAKKLF